MFVTGMCMVDEKKGRNAFYSRKLSKAVNLHRSEEKKNEQTDNQTATLFYVRFCYIINTKLAVTFSELSRYSRYTQSVFLFYVFVYTNI